MQIGIDPELGDAICTAIERVHGIRVDLIMIVVPEGDWTHPEFASSVEPDVFEAVIMQLGEQLAASKLGKRTARKGRD